MNQRLTLASLTALSLLLSGFAPAANSKASDAKRTSDTRARLDGLPGFHMPDYRRPVRTASIQLILVTNTNDAGPGSLRQALLDANSHVGPDSIAFNIPKSDPGYNGFISSWTIKPLSQLPLLEDNGTILEGASQRGFFPGANPNGPPIELDGSLAGSPVTGLSIICAHTWVHALAINHFSDDGIIIAGPTHSYNVIYECYIGVTPDARSKAPNLKSGIEIVDADHNWIPLPDMAPNVIGGNGESGIMIRGLGSQLNFVGPNFIGTDPLYIQNLGNGGDGITIKNGAVDNVVGIYFFPFTVVWNNQQAGIRVSGAATVRNMIGAGSVTHNGGPGILLEDGANNSMQAPVISQVTIDHIEAQALPNSFVGFFRDMEDEGEECLGLGFADALGNVTYSGPVRGPYITAVAIDTTTGSTQYNTSPFSSPVPFATRLEVTNTLDSGPGSLRQAIIDANGRIGPDSITFAIPASDPGYSMQFGTWTIKPQTFLPSVLDRETIIEGFSQNEFSGSDVNPLGPEIELDGSLVSNYAGFYIGEQGSGSVIQGLVINHFSSAGIFIDGADSTQVNGCYIGTDATGTQSAPNGFGIVADRHAYNTMIGRSQNWPGNLISGNTYEGIEVRDSSTGTFFFKNTMGLDRTRTRKLGNGTHDIFLHEGSGEALVFDNWLGGSNFGIVIDRSNDCIVEENIVGTDTSCQLDVGNQYYGVYLEESQRTNVTGNWIAHNGTSGVYIFGSSALYNLLTHNRISHHPSPGILNMNGGNAEYASPGITGLVGWILSGTAQPNDNIEVFADSTDEADIFIGETQAGADGKWSLTLGGAPPRRFLTATARDAGGNTSGFSAPFDYVTAGVAGEQAEIPKSFALEQNYPNPFNPKTGVRFSVAPLAPRDLVSTGGRDGQVSGVSDVKITVYDLLGREVAVLVNEKKTLGRYEVPFDASGLASGVYVYRMTAGAFVQSRKMVLVK